MAATNIFYRIPSQRGTRVATISGSKCTLHQFCDYILDNEGLNRNDFIIASGTKVFRPNRCSLQSICLQNNSHVDILIPLLGGKGGFGSLLRAIGAQIEKTTNRDACRDLSGRRLRDIKREEELKKLVALQEKLLEERTRRRNEKLENLKKKSEISNKSTPIQELVAMFDDHEYNKRRLELGDIIEAAVDKGIINFKKRQLKDDQTNDAKDEYEERSKKLRLEEGLNENVSVKASEDVEKTNIYSNKDIHQKVCRNFDLHRSEKNNKVKKNDLWLGLDDEDEDEDEEDEVEECYGCR